MGMDQRYDVAVAAPGRDAVGAHREPASDGAPRLRRDARPAPRARSPGASLAGVTARYPAATLRMLALIYGHAVALKLKGVPRPAPPARDSSHDRTRSPAAIVLHAPAPHQRRPADRRRGRRAPTCSAPGAPQATVRRPRSARVWPRCSRQPRAGASPTATACGTRPTSPPSIRVAARNVHGLDEIRRRARARCACPSSAPAAFRAQHAERSREDIAAHYDLGNDLFELMLDPTMMYSCGVFERRDSTLEEASLAKLELVCEQARPRPRRPRARDRHRLGRLRRPRRRARAAAASRRRRSPREQHEVAVARVREAGLEDRVTVLLDDYRDLRGTLRQARLDRDDRGGRLARLRHVLRPLLGPAGARRRDAAAGDHDRRPRLRGREGLARASSARTSSRTAACPRSRSSPRCLRDADRHAHGRTSRTSRRTTPRRCAAGATNFDAHAERARRRSATTSASAACGACTSPTARRASPSAASASCRRCWPSRAGAASPGRGDGAGAGL